MAILEPTPYRVYYLLNNYYVKSDNYSVNCIWHSKRINEKDKTGVINYYIDTKFKEYPDFYSLMVCPRKETMIITDYSIGSTKDYKIEDMDETPWNDIDEFIVDIIKKFYKGPEESQNILFKNNNYEKVIAYADFMQKFIDHPEDIIRTSIDDNGLPVIDIDGLVYNKDPYRKLDIRIKSSKSGTDYEYTINPEMNSKLSFSTKNLYDYKRKSENYDGACRMIHDAVRNY